jgi:hypothetical protein
MLYSFPFVSFLLEGFSHKVFDEATCTIQNAVDMYSFLQEPFFPLGFRVEFLMRHMHSW